jgi:UDP:flavonoid glycosyltransferase YjiC (YdhE family)
MAQNQKSRVLFVSESVTLAHFARPFELSNQLSNNDFDIHFACDLTYQKFLHDSKHTTHTIHSISPSKFKQSLNKGSPLYDYATLKSYVEDDLDLIHTIKPDLIVGDFRISLAVSARLAKIPYATISNAYWSPYAPRQYPAPCLPLTRYLGLAAGSLLFKLAAPLAFKVHALAMRRLHDHFGLPKIPLDLRQVYTEADYTLYADIPSLFPLDKLPENHFFIGPILWSPPIPEPNWWHSLPTDRPIIYVSMGSSGSERALEKILNTFAKEKVTVIATVAGSAFSNTKLSNIFTAEYLDGNAAAKRADLVICNGGSLSCQQAFFNGKPVLGIASNMDQFLNMAGVSRVNAGLLLRADNLTETRLINSYASILNNAEMNRSLKSLKIETGYLLDQKQFANFVSSVQHFKS